MNAIQRPRVLCVDDEARVLEGLALNLRNEYDVLTALNGEQALQRMREARDIAVVVSDLRMPGMNGATLLQEIRENYPETTRILLTGEAGRDAAVVAVNQGQIFRFLTKPCPVDRMRAAIEAGVMQHRLVTAERNVLKETLVGCVRALFDVLAITNPVAFGRASRVTRLAMEFSMRVGTPDFWQLEAAAMLSQIGYISLPIELVEKLYFGEPLTPEEQVLAGGVPQVAINLLERVPRLEPVMQILTALAWTDEQVARLGDGTVGLGSRILGLSLAYDALTAQGHAPEIAVQTLRGRSARFGSELVEAFAAHLGTGTGSDEVREMELRYVRPGMVVLQDVRTHLGTLLVARGFEATPSFVERIRNFGPEVLAEHVRVLVPAPKPAGAPAA